MKTSNHLLFIVLAIIFHFHSCQNIRKPFEPQPEFQAYVAHFSQILPESASPLRITMAFRVDDSIRQDALITSSLLTFDPPVNGEVSWADEQTIVFTPLISWPAAEKFVNVSFFLGKLKELPANFHIFRFHLRLIPPAITAAVPQLVSDGDSLWIEGHFGLSHPVSEPLHENMVEATLNGRNLPLHKAMASAGKQINYKSKAFKALDKEQSLTVAWDAGAIGIRRKGQFTIDIPSADCFRVVQLQAIMHPGQYIRMRLSQPPADEQNLASMIMLEPEVPFSVTSTKNLIQIEPLEKLSGHVRLRLAPGLRSLSGKVIETAYDTLLTFGEMLPAVRLLNSSSIISGDNMMLPFQTIGLRAVDVQVVKVFGNNMLRHLQANDLDGSYDLRLVGRVVAREQLIFSAADETSLMGWQNRAIDLSKLILQDQSALYRVYITFRKNYAVLPCGVESTELQSSERKLSASDLRQWGADYYYQPDYYFPDNFEWDQRDNPCHESYYFHERFVSKSLYYTRLGIIAKRAQEQKDFRLYVTDLQEGKPVSDAVVELYDFQLQRIARGKTDAEGHVLLSQNIVDAWMAVASYGNNTTYLKLDGGQMQALGRFDVEGIRPSAGMKGFIFTERGVYRPGDTLFVGFILDNNTLPKDHPVVLELSDARNRPAGRKTQTFGQSRLIRFSMPTNAEAPTGIWTAKITVGNASFSRRIRVETVIPNRLKINFIPENKRFGHQETKPEIVLNINWLHGDPAAGQRVVAEQSLSDVPINFPGFDDFSFTNHSIETFRAEKTQLIDGLADAAGRIAFRLRLPDPIAFRGRRAVDIEVRAYEPGGSFSVASNRYISDTYSHYIGIQSPQQEKWGYLEPNRTHQFSIVRLNNAGQTEGNVSLTYELFRLDDYWWWSGDDNARASYVSTSNAAVIEKGTVLLNGGQGTLEWKPGRFDWGQYMLVLSENGGHSASVRFGILGSGNELTDRKPAGASHLRINANKEGYKVGEKAILSFEAPSDGRVLLSLENGSRQLSWRWVNTTKGLNRIEIPLRPEHSPNVYAHLSLLQPLGQVDNDMPSRLFGIVNLKVENPQRQLIPVIEAPTTAEAEKQFSVKVSEQKGRPMSYLLAIVDEGLLDLTGFRTPDPYNHFNQREALGVSTWDMFDQVLGAYGGKLEQVMAVGGDENLPKREKARQQRFRPVVMVKGPFQLQAGNKDAHTFTIRNYSGSVRVMLIAANDYASGSADQRMQVRNDLMILATTPRLLRKNDEFIVPVTLFTGKNMASEISVNIRAEGKLQIVGLAQQMVRTTGKGEQTLNFRIKALDEGSGRLVCTARSNDLSAKHEISLSVENPFPRQYQLQQLWLEAGKSAQVLPDWPGQQMRKAWIEVSNLPDIQLSMKVDQLLSYPHGCTEQLSSQAMAMLYLPSLIKTSNEEKQQYERAMASALRQLENRITADGRISYWPGTTYYNEWTEVYAAHLLLLASRENLYTESQLLKRVVAAQERLAQRWGAWQAGPSEYLVQAYRLYMLALAGKPVLNAMNRLRELPQLDARSARMLALAYAAAGQKQAARELALGLSKRPEPASQFEAINFGSPLRDQSLQVMTMLAMEERASALNLLNQLAADTRNSYLNTQETGWLMLSWQEYARKYPSSVSSSYEISGMKDNPFTLQTSVRRHQLSIESGKLNLKNTGQQPLLFTLTTSAIPEESNVRPKSKDLSLQVQYTSPDGKTLSASEIRQGETAEMKVTVKNLTDRRLDYLALQTMLPAGWEVLTSRSMSEDNPLVPNATADFTDLRDDRVISYFALDAMQQCTFVVRISATYAGSFVHPGVQCHAMYEPSTEAMTGASRITIKRAGER